VRSRGEEVREYGLRESRADKAIREYDEERMRRTEEDVRARDGGAGGSNDSMVREILEEARGEEESMLAETEDMQSLTRGP
jgi:hypothetical protein